MGDTLNHILVDFNMIVNTDIGLIYTIKDEYNQQVFFEQFIFNISEKELIGELLNMESINPINMFIKPKDEGLADKIRNQFLEKEYDKILNKSIHTDIKNIMELYLTSGLVFIDILCRNKQEEQLIKSINSKFNTIIVNDYKEVNIDNYSAIYIKDFRQILNFNPIKGKTIYIANCKFNLEENKNKRIIPLSEVSILLADVNKMCVIDLYEKQNYIIIQGNY